MQQALGLSGDLAMMFAIMVALGIAGIVALMMALFWPPRWRMTYRVEVVGVLVLVALGVFADLNSASTFNAYEEGLSNEELSGTSVDLANQTEFDRVITVFAYQWSFLFLDEQGRASRSATTVKPGERILFKILSNDVIHGFNIPAARLITEVDPGGMRAVWIRAPDEPGKYLIQCVDYCGLGHHQMKAWLVVEGDSEDHADGGGMDDMQGQGS